MNVKVYKGGNITEKALNEQPFGDQILYRTLKSAVLSFQANQRQGTVKTRGRSEVAGSGKKPWKQKHTGRARAGDRMSPIWRGGGTVFGPIPRDHRFDLPARERRVALRSALFGTLPPLDPALRPVWREWAL
jgi:large subunit ribosomal protein L4